MATLWIREYERLASGGGVGAGAASGATPIPQEPGTDQSTVSFTTSTQSAAFGANTKFVSIISDAAFHYVVGPNPSATTGARKVPADTAVEFGVTAGHKVAAVTAS